MAHAASCERPFALDCLAGNPRTLIGTSYYPERLVDDKAVHLEGATGDGVADDTDAIQRAINRVVASTIRGIVFIPSGSYRVTRTLEVWPGIRLIGHGQTRPVFVLGDATPGYQTGRPAYMVHFAGNMPGHRGNGYGFIFQPGSPRPDTIDFTQPATDANPGTFYSAISNIDFVIGEGNADAVAVRSTFAQHCFLAHGCFNLGTAMAAIHDGGNVCEDLHILGGRHGIVTGTPSPGWQYVLVDVSFADQTVSSIRSTAAGLTLIRPSFRHVPTAVEMDRQRGEQLWIRDGRMCDISGPALIIGNSSGSRNQINLVNVVCQEVPVFASHADGGRDIYAPGPIYRVSDCAHGLHLSGAAASVAECITETRVELAVIDELPAPVPSDIPELPPQSGWMNVRDLGVAGDGVTDDTAALRQAVAKHRTLYFPCGAYRISDTLQLRPDTVLIGLHAGAVRIFIDDGTPAFAGLGPPVAMIEAPSGGTTIMLGMGVYTNGINPRAVAVKWMAGEHSLMNDVRFLGGHGTAKLSGDPEPFYNSNRTGDADPQRRWDSQPPSLWITDGGGGTFLDIWSASSFAQAGLLISHTSTPGRIYAMSVEHHVRCEVKLDHVAHWDLYALQLEEERGESGHCQPLDLLACHDVTLANLFIYRVISSNQPHPSAVRCTGSHDIFFRGFHCWTNSKADFDQAIIDMPGGGEIRQFEFASFRLDGRRPVVTAEHRQLHRLGGTFHRLAGGTVDGRGRFYAVDASRQEIHRWTGLDMHPVLISDQPHQPVNLIAEDSGKLLVVSYAGVVYVVDPEQPSLPIQVLNPQPVVDRPDARIALPANFYSSSQAWIQDRARPWTAHFVSPDHSVVIPADEAFLSGTLSWGVKDHDLLRAYGLQSVRPGGTAYLNLESAGKTCAAEVGASGRPTRPRLFAEHGGQAVAVGPDGNIYIAEGHIMVYDPLGRWISTIHVPERPLGLVFGGADGRTLYIPAGTSLYAMHLD